MSIVSSLSDSVRSSSERRPASWQRSIREAIRRPEELCRLLGIAPVWGADAAAGAQEFPVFVPRELIARMRPGDPHDPLLLQVLPTASESTLAEGDVADPVGDLAAELTPGLLHKYRARVLMVTTGACAVHCRYCFRRHFPYGEAPKSLADWEPALARIAADGSLREVILSGGNPLMLIDSTLAELAQRLAQIDHLRRIRIHTRLPIMIPSRVTDELIAWLTSTRLTPIVVVHANHPAEIDSPVADALVRLVRSGITTLNQSVLLRGVNDDAETLIELSNRLIDAGVIPYYLHQLDRVRGAAHFEVPIETGKKIIAAMRAALPGYAVPTYVQEVAGAPNKVALGERL